MDEKTRRFYEICGEYSTANAQNINYLLTQIDASQHAAFLMASAGASLTQFEAAFNRHLDPKNDEHKAVVHKRFGEMMQYALDRDFAGMQHAFSALCDDLGAKMGGPGAEEVAARKRG